jgi:hypothetical protein
MLLGSRCFRLEDVTYFFETSDKGEIRPLVREGSTVQLTLQYRSRLLELESGRGSQDGLDPVLLHAYRLQMQLSVSLWLYLCSCNVR